MLHLARDGYSIYQREANISATTNTALSEVVQSGAILKSRQVRRMLEEFNDVEVRKKAFHHLDHHFKLDSSN